MTISHALKQLLFLVVACFCLTEFVASRYESKGAYISLHAKWNATSLLLEAVEFMADEDPQLLWKFIELWNSQEGTDENCWQRVARAGNSLLTKNMGKMFQLLVGLRNYSPKVEMYRQLSAQLGAPQDACCWGEVEGSRVHSGAALKAAVAAALSAGAGGADSKGEVFPFDHSYPGSGGGGSVEGSVLVVVYGALGTACFKELHEAAVEGAEGSSRVHYVWRPLLAAAACASDPLMASGCAAAGAQGFLDLPGFGAEFVLKNMEYKTLDDSKRKSESEGSGVKQGLDEGPMEVKGFLFDKLIARKPQLKTELLAFRDHLLASALEEDTLKVWDMKELGVQASQRVLQASDPLFMLTQISQNFPGLASSVSRTALNRSVMSEMSSNQRLLPGGRNLMVLNGISLDMDDLDLFALLDRLRSEVRLADAMSCSGLAVGDVMSLMLLRAKVAPGSNELRVDLRHEAVVWLNDLESDAVYRRWPRELYTVLQPTMPGRMQRVGRNLFNGIMVLDPGTAAGLEAFHGAMSVVSERFPIRVGIIFFCPQLMDRIVLGLPDPGEWDELSLCEQVGRAFFTIRAAFDTSSASNFVVALKRAVDMQQGEEGEGITPQLLEKVFVDHWNALLEYKGGISASKAWDDVEGGNGVAEGAAEALRTATQVALDKGVSGSGGSSGGLLFMNGEMVERGEGGEWRSLLITSAMYQLSWVQESVYYGRLSDNDDWDGPQDLHAAILRAHNALPRFNPLIFGDDDGVNTRMVSISGAVLGPRSNPLLGQLPYLHPPGSEDKLKPVTFWLVFDPDSQASRQLLSEALRYLLGSEAQEAGVRMGLLLNPGGGAGAPSLLTSLLLASTRLSSRRAKLPGFLAALLKDSTAWQDQEAALKLAEDSGLNRKAFEAALSSGAGTPAAAQQQLAGVREVLRALGVAPGESGVVCNGRLLVVRNSARDINAGDYALMVMYAKQRMYAEEVETELEIAALDERAVLPGEDGEEEPMSAEELSDAAMIISSSLKANKVQVDGISVRLMAALDKFGSQYSSITIPAAGDAPLNFVVFLNPLSKAAQKLSALLALMQSALSTGVQLFMNPVREISELPLKNFYRYALPEIEVAGDLLQFTSPPTAYFSSLPPSKVLTLHMDVPQAWLVESYKADYDLDNFKPEQLGSEPNMYAEFELEALLLSGSCTDLSAKSREQSNPRGVQVELGDLQQPHLSDTLVMANLGYFQLKSNPGLWFLQLAPGRSQELFRIVGSSGLGEEVLSEAALAAQPWASATRVPVILASFDGKLMQLRLRKVPGKEDEDVLDTSSESPIDTGKKAGGEAEAGGKAGDDVVNLFTVASGHMYERLQKIMILSVVKTCSMRVKFWFIKNYMSPQMKQFVPYMAAKYGFDYELVTYKWPPWLNKQTDKQRIIWAYKILFLDVLFPLSVNKVIFLDADQIIRGDLAELWHMDLQGAPYAYTPFCDNNKDMDGFRFWKQGFWRDHLRGRPYHISALYVVDLARFRQMAAGDQLRVVYDSLSRDPNSLANLDQDLPNYAQHNVHIFSLPQEWLWCETWCGNTSKAAAKTIDLCNNPLTKEPKLEGARRIVAEWPALDQEAQDFTAQVEQLLAGQAVGGTPAGAEPDAVDVPEQASDPSDQVTCGDEGGSCGMSAEQPTPSQQYDEL